MASENNHKPCAQQKQHTTPDKITRCGNKHPYYVLTINMTRQKQRNKINNHVLTTRDKIWSMGILIFTINRNKPDKSVQILSPCPKHTTHHMDDNRHSLRATQSHTVTQKQENTPRILMKSFCFHKNSCSNIQEKINYFSITINFGTSKNKRSVF